MNSINQSRVKQNQTRVPGKTVKKAIIPTFCFAVLSTVAFHEAVFAEQPTTVQTSINSKIVTKYVNIDGGSLNLRQSASTSSAVVASLSKGTAVSVYSEANGWAKIKANGKVGYVSSKFLSSANAGGPSKQPAASVTTKYVDINGGSLNLRQSASTSSAVVASLSKGTAVSVYSEANGWAKIKANGKVGYVSSKFLSSANAGGLSKQPAASVTTKYVNIEGGSLNLRQRASTSSAVVASLSKGTAVSVYSEANGWAKIKANGKEGYVSSKFLSSANASGPSKQPAASFTTKYVNIEGGSLNLRQRASTSSAVVASLSKGTAISVYSEANGWAKVKANGKVGYVSSKFLSSANAGGPSKQPAASVTTKYVNIEGGSLNLRQRASTSSAVVASLSKGTAVSVYSEANGWAKIKANGKVGYVSSKFLSSANAGGPSKQPAASVTTKYVNIEGGSLNLRQRASTSSAVVASLSKGTAVSVYSEANGWAKVKANGKEGYVSSSFLSSKESNSTSKETANTPAAKYVNVTSGALNMRNKPSLTASIIIKLAKGTAVKVYSNSGGWAKIEVYGKTGYVSSEFLADKKQGNTSNSSPQEAAKTETKYVNINAGSSLNVRKGPSTGSAILTKLENKAEVKALEETNGWTKVQINKQIGYVSSEFLASKNTNSKPAQNEEPKTETKYVNVSLGSSLNMRTIPSTDASILLKLAKGVQVTVFSEEKGWAKIQAYGKTGYVSIDFLTAEKPLPGSNSSSEKDPGEDSNTDSKNNNNDTTENTPAPGTSTDNGSSSTPGPAAENGSNPASKPDTDTEQNTEPSEPTADGKYVNVIYGSSLNMRDAASTKAAIITKLARGTIVKVKSEANGWSQVVANGKTGYVSSQYLSDKAPFNPNTASGNIEKLYENYDINLEDMTKLEMAANPQTDKKYDTYIRSDALILTSPASGTVNGIGWNIRGGAGANFWNVGQVNNKETLQILGKVKGNDGYDWYKVAYNRTWVNASPEDVNYYINPKNFLNNTADSLQFLKLSKTTSLSVKEVNERVLSGKGILQGQASTFMTAGEKYGVNEMYLISHALLETSNGSSILAKGVKVNGKTVYNMYGIGAFDSDPINTGAQFAYNSGWFTPEAAIIGGARFIANGYINAGQDTLYKMKWNPKTTVSTGKASHQYATDIGWAAKQVYQMHNLYSLVDSYKLVLEIPKYN
ncbi:SH3 domain-containing protein [Neobacillus mesonae]|uniref:SH3 domain-containing protein n=1 Tax=Neobacillus mesonae TaxID=1193713 RepID=UPI00203CCFE1|nr:SH3 domain-containing protein [Neobacillus mesonae]MCM3570725.1 SH3 domain-containing protein [Neobacillus mesonae]